MVSDVNGRRPGVMIVAFAAFLLIPMLTLTRVAAAQDDAGSAAPEFDRITLTNGEVHDGRLAKIAGGTVTLKSEGGDLSIPADKIASIQLTDATRTYYYMTTKRTEPESIDVTVRDGKLVGAADGTPLNLDDYFLMQDSEIDDRTWTFNGSLIFTAVSGTTKSYSAGLVAELVSESFYDKLTLRYEFSYQEAEDAFDVKTVSQRKHLFFADYRYFFASNWGAFITNTFFTDKINGFVYSNVTALGVTWNALETADTIDFLGESMSWTSSLLIDVGVSHTFEEQVGLDSTSYAGLLAAIEWTNKFGSNLTSITRIEFGMSFDDTDDYTVMARETIRMKLSDVLATALILELNYQNQPAPGFNNSEYKVVWVLTVSLS
jgi:hypothetical protein